MNTAYPSSSTNWSTSSVKSKARRPGSLWKICDETARRWKRWTPPSYKVYSITAPTYQI